MTPTTPTPTTTTNAITVEQAADAITSVRYLAAGPTSTHESVDAAVTALGLEFVDAVTLRLAMARCRVKPGRARGVAGLLAAVRDAARLWKTSQLVNRV